MPESLARTLIGAWLILIMSSFQALPRTLREVFIFSLRAGLGHIGLRGRSAGHPRSQTRLLLHVQRLARMLLVLPGSQLWKALCCPGLTCDLACIFLRGGLVSVHGSGSQPVA